MNYDDDTGYQPSSWVKLAASNMGNSFASPSVNAYFARVTLIPALLFVAAFLCAFCTIFSWFLGSICRSFASWRRKCQLRRKQRAYARNELLLPFDDDNLNDSSQSRSIAESTDVSNSNDSGFRNQAVWKLKASVRKRDIALLGGLAVASAAILFWLLVKGMMPLDHGIHDADRLLHSLVQITDNMTNLATELVANSKSLEQDFQNVTRVCTGQTGDDDDMFSQLNGHLEEYSSIATTIQNILDGTLQSRLKRYRHLLKKYAVTFRNVSATDRLLEQPTKIIRTAMITPCMPPTGFFVYALCYRSGRRYCRDTDALYRILRAIPSKVEYRRFGVFTGARTAAAVARGRTAEERERALEGVLRLPGILLLALLSLVLLLVPVLVRQGFRR